MMFLLNLALIVLYLLRDPHAIPISMSVVSPLAAPLSMLQDPLTNVFQTSPLLREALVWAHSIVLKDK